MSDPAIALVVGLGVLMVFVAVMLGARRYPRGREEVATETWRRTVESRLGHFENDLRKTKHDVGNMRMAMQTLPTAKDVYEVRNKVSELSGEMKGMSQSLGSLHAGLGRIENFMMDVGAKRIVGIRDNDGAEP